MRPRVFLSDFETRPSYLYRTGPFIGPPVRHTSGDQEGAITVHEGLIFFASTIIATIPTIDNLASVTIIDTKNVSIFADERIVCRMARFCFLIWFCSFPSPPNLVHHALYVKMF